MSTKFDIEINHQKIQANPGQMIIEVADEHGIYIPRFCYHKKLSIAANCRMCLVEVDKMPKTVPACATPISDGMKVFTQSEKTRESQQIVMEFLLINHPLDCPVCDQGGQCELQDFSLQYGQDLSQYKEPKRAVDNEDFGPLIATEMTRCIHCTRCVRFGEEVAGQREIGATHRGESTHIGTYIQHTVSHELSGNVIDLCPVGALLSKPFLYKARAWELQNCPSIAPHDAFGSPIAVHTRRSQVMRVVPRTEEWLSDRDRFSYLGLNEERLALPMIKEGQLWREVTWSVAINYVAEALEKVYAVHGKNQIAAAISPNTTTEEAYLLKRLMNHFSSNAIEYRLRQQYMSNERPVLGVPLEALASHKNIWLIGSHLRQEVPLFAHHLRQAALAGSAIHMVDMVAFPYHFTITSRVVVKPSEFLNAVLAIRSVPENSLVLMGGLALSHPYADQLYAHLSSLGCTVGQIPAGANAVGCHDLGAFHPEGAHALWSVPRRAYFLHDVEPDQDIAYPTRAIEALHAADLVVAVTSFKSKALDAVANVLLPKAAFAETSGTYTNMFGVAQSFQGVVKPFAEARPAWKIYRVLANVLEMTESEYTSSEEVLAKVEPLVIPPYIPAPFPRTIPTTAGLEVISGVSCYRADPLVRRSPPLQAMLQQQRAMIMNDSVPLGAVWEAI